MNWNILVEGSLDEQVCRRLLSDCGHSVAAVYGRRGNQYIREKIQGFDAGARGMPLLTLVDLDASGHNCPVALVADWLPTRENGHVFRVVIREIEAWLLADFRNLAEFLRVNIALMPRNVEQILDPKESLINVARRSRSREIREGVVPAGSYSAKEGVLYNDLLGRFVFQHWDPGFASLQADSLRRCLNVLREL